MSKLKKPTENEQVFMGEMGQFDNWGRSACVVGKKMKISEGGSVSEQRTEAEG